MRSKPRPAHTRRGKCCRSPNFALRRVRDDEMRSSHGTINSWFFGRNREHIHTLTSSVAISSCSTVLSLCLPRQTELNFLLFNAVSATKRLLCMCMSCHATTAGHALATLKRTAVPQTKRVHAPIYLTQRARSRAIVANLKCHRRRG